MKVRLIFEMPNHGFDVVEKPLEAINHSVRVLMEEIPIGQIEAEFCNCDTLDLEDGSKHNETCPAYLKWNEINNLLDSIEKLKK